ncbi:M28 family peptidase [Eggerthellaceae bacterium zg-887]|uniref:M28 family peptidase n=1 Tax=Xiamenia xianingshaonis TaxID=2682776 RepID=UPI00140E0FB3|nr:M28 family peptidase [Xiamenia xianingshaonis]NHM16390.1 M28 family peptidase [Xiamenia xianingshaonis]
MSDMIDSVTYLAQEIGPRPAGTEEEQQAALYITESMQKEARLSTVIEDFRGLSSTELLLAVLCLCSVVMAVLATALPVVDVAAVVVTALVAAVFASESLGKPVVSRLLGRGVSQNVVAKYDPELPSEAGSAHHRKVVLVARYDSGKVTRETAGSLVRLLPALQWFTLGSVVLLPVLLLLRAVFFPAGGGLMSSIVNILIIVALIGTALPCVQWVLHKTAPYNEGANCNGAGVAMLLEVAKRVGQGRVTEAEIAEREEAVIHGKEEALAAGVVPEGAELVYETDAPAPAGAPAGHQAAAEASPDGGLAAAKAAIAAMTGRPVAGAADSYDADAAADVPANGHSVVVDQVAQAAPELEATPQASESPVQQVEAAPAMFYAPHLETRQKQASSVPDWYVKAQEKAKRPRGGDKPAQRSRYASALDAAVRESAGHFAEANRIVGYRLEETLSAGKEVIREVEPPAAATARAAAGVAAGTGAGFAGQQAAAAAPAQPAQAAQPMREAPAQAVPAQAAAVREIAAQAAAPAQAAPMPAAPVRDAVPAQAAQPMREESVAPQAAPQAAPAPAPVPEQAPSAGEPLDMGTTAMPPIDVSQLVFEEPPATPEPAMPSFLDPAKVQAAAQASRRMEDRSSDRVVAAKASVDASGTIAVVTDEASFDASAEASEGPAPARTETPRRPEPRGEQEHQVTMRDADSERPQQESYVQEATQTFADRVMQRRRARRPVVLPEVDESAKLAPVREVAKQRAPLAEAAESGQAAAKSLLSMLPAITADDIVASHGGAEEAKADPLLAALPSLSGSFARVGDSSKATVGAAGSFAPASSTSSFAPIGDEFVEEMDPEDIYVDDADDSAYNETFAESGAIASGEYLDMPKSRLQRLFGRFRKEKKAPEPEVSTQEWLDVDEDFDAREVGAQRGGWESFRTANDDVADQTTAFSPLDADDDIDDGFDDYDDSDNGRASWHGGGYSGERLMESSDLNSEEIAEEAAVAAAQPVEVDEELKQIYAFRNPDVNAEVWFVALGAELSTHDGMRAFLDEHAHELRGAIVVDLDALGAGDITMIEEEGLFRPVKTSSRMKRYVKKASQASGVSVRSAKLRWMDSSASYATRRGIQSMHLVGLRDGKPAYYGQDDDTVEHVSEEKLNNNAKFVMEMIKNI